MSEESITLSFTTDKSFYQRLTSSNDYEFKIMFKGIFLKQDRVSFLHK